MAGIAPATTEFTFMGSSTTYRMLTLISIIAMFFSCGNDDPVNQGDPSNLAVEITVADDGSGVVGIIASAYNAVEFRLYVNSGEEPEDINTTGIFEYVFTKSGFHTIEVRAYGSSGRFLKERRQIEISYGNNVSPEDGYTSPLSYPGYQLVWNDEFEGNSINAENWVFETGNGCPNCGWGNNELQYYRRENASVEGGLLSIEARKESFGGRSYTSARLKTQDLKSFRYGRIDIRALLPKGQGIWPALWMLGNDIRSVGWPQCGEIDIMEMIGGSGRENTTHGTLHWDHLGSHASSGGSYSLSAGTFADEYHVFSITWDESTIRWYVNDKEFHVMDVTPSNMSEFHQKFFFIFNVAVGGAWPGNPDSTTIFPQTMKVDYVRVFQKE